MQQSRQKDRTDQGFRWENEPNQTAEPVEFLMD